MKVCAVIAEYNPFHLGHEYQIAKAKEQTNADYVIAIQSGNFTQRGSVAIVDKYERAKMALMGGADLVLELPSLFATASAEYFASEGVALLDSTGVVDTLICGIEETDCSLLLAAASAVNDWAVEDYDRLVLSQKQGNSFPVARAKYLSKQLSTFDEQRVLEALTQPNNILAIEYQRALSSYNSAITLHPIVRKGMGYHDTTGDGFASATAIRNNLLSDQSIDALVPASTKQIFGAYPVKLLSNQDLSDLLYYKLLLHQREGYTEFADCSQALSDKIRKNLSEFVSFEQFVSLLKTKDLTYTRISRTMLHILLSYTKNDYECYRNGQHGYLRILGFKKDASPLLNAIKNNAALPLITKVADAPKLLDAKSYSLFEKDIFAADLYNRLSGNTIDNEYTKKFPIL